MKITFVKPNFNYENSHDAMQPLAFAMLTAITPKNIKLELYDERIEKIPLNLNTDLIAMSVDTYMAKRAYNLSAEFRKKGIPVVMGGYHPTLMPEEAKKHADSIIIGEAEDIWKEVLNDFSKGKLKKVYKNEKQVDITELKVDRSIFRGKKYVPMVPIQFSRGCKQDCDFCNVKSFYGKGIRYRSINNIIKEIKGIKEKTLFFVDDNLFCNKQKITELLRKMIPLKKKWACQSSIDVAFQEDLLRLMKKSGCISILIGFESLSMNNLKDMNKHLNIRYSDYPEAIKKIKNHKIMIYGSFLAGYDNDTLDNIDKTANFAINNKFLLTNFNPLMPLPKTRLYNKLETEGRLTYKKWWLEDAYRYGKALMIPKNMSPTQLSEGIHYARLKFNKKWNIIKRSLDFKANVYHLPTFFIANLISRKEMLRKRGIKLG
tara:strand:- start:3315 stop:4607 length:1293 start_codon:yes stop_codon:yes gene_type:complete